MAEGFCTHCGQVIETFEGLSHCPKCGTAGVPCDYKNQTKVSINTHELRILCIWAERWVMEMKNERDQMNSAAALRGITGRLLPQLPSGTCLLLSDELEGLKKEGLDVETNMTPL